jgi:hypothetical protein
LVEKLQLAEEDGNITALFVSIHNSRMGGCSF